MFSPLRILKAGETYDTIRGRVCRLWRNTDYNTGRLISVDCLLVDEQVIKLNFFSIIIFINNNISILLNHIKLIYIYIYILQDEAIHGFVRAKYADFITSKIQVGNIYEINNFFCHEQQTKVQNCST